MSDINYSFDAYVCVCAHVRVHVCWRPDNDVENHLNFPPYSLRQGPSIKPRAHQYD